MTRKSRRRFSLSTALALTAFSLAGFASSPPTGPAAGADSKADPLTVGQVAKRLVTEISLNAPSGGVDEKYAMGVMRTLGYSAERPGASSATVGDLQAMLSVFGVEASSGHPGDALSDARLSQAMNAVRGSLPRFDIPDASRIEGVDPPGRNIDPPGPCRIAMMACKNECIERSPSGTGGGRARCIQDCQEAFFKCRKNREKPPDRRD